ncbi:ABC transporter substrate-binding protein [Pseudalkalibacillus salsuginis]|uniref:ABC transporter substrate-binding protein n=1 Tax=Pseudalkalibacillus salsuginis TaxID=2910972 RepID=UPI001F1FE65B|nr:ABC transporter substrate-binding protein [Pseudalkalibacillus salsuginis]MCF6409643.1 ABC transporter substrate-binding protein [Pseudalkalibacillus salsuginis]
MSKKFFGIVVLMALLVLAACSGESVTDSDSDNNASNNDEEEVQKDVTVWYYYTGKQEELFLTAIDEYNGAQDVYEVKAEYVPFPDVKKQLSVGLAGGTLPDMVQMDVVDNASFAAQGVLEDITSLVEEWGEADQFYEGPLKSVTYNDGYYGLPVGSNALGLFYNVDMLEEAGVEPPTTWDELLETAETLTSGDTKGFAISAVKSEEGAFQYYPFLRSSGAEYTDLDSEGAIGSLSLLTQLVEEGSMGADVVNATQDDLARQFAQGKLAMMVNGPWNIERLKSENPDLNFAITQIPKDEEYASVLGGENLAIIKDSNVSGAFDFLTWFLETERTEKFSAETGVFPARKDALENSDFWTNDEHLRGFVPIMDVADPRGPSPEWPEISDAIQIALQEALTGTKSPKEALQGAAEKVDEILN